MIRLRVKEGDSSRVESFDKTEITIGHGPRNDVVLQATNEVSKYHTRIVLKDGRFILVDLRSATGTYVNGTKLRTPQVIRTTDEIGVGGYTLQLVEDSGGCPP